MTDIHTLSGAYALHALTGSEVTRFEQHTDGCDECAHEVRALRETAARLALAVAEPPPAALRGRVLAAVKHVRQAAPDPTRVLPFPDGAGRTQASPGGQETVRFQAPPGEGETVRFQARAIPLPQPPVPGADPGAGPGGAGPGGAGPGGAGPGGAGPGGAGPGGAGPGGAGGDVVEMRGRTPWRTRLALSLTAAAAAAAVTLGVIAYDTRGELDRSLTAQRELVSVLAAPDARTVRRPVTSGGTATVVYSRDRGRLVFTSSGLPELGDGRVYELWLMGPDGPRPAGLLTRDGGGTDGTTVPVFARPLGDDRHIGLTVEPAGGSSRPTTTPILFAELPQA
ncbi:anti-sigma factor [Nonomuraea soli]|uniref:Regulator of SigK n=1 Tax=Nonomuraea soli TaxID=1032476 RepID=A0A7W0HPG2_9ACTN|nr:anti-sigma factor [Nonomuraea soli]MBA2890546.1 anti-sigma-K factor RskA [Nonomuraea soli]